MRRLFLLMNFVIVMFLSACGGEEITDPLNYQVQPFQMIDQNKEAFRFEDVEDTVWIADFVFTSCETICPPMTANLKRLQDKLKENHLDVEIVSFSVDPEIDTPAKLKAFVEKFQGDQSSWHLLSGYDQEFIHIFAMKGFKTIVDKPENNSQVIHGTRFYLVAKDGIVKKSYDGVSNTPYDEIVKDVKVLLD